MARLAPLVHADVPILSVCGADDTAVPFEENTQILVARYRQLGGKMEVILKQGCGHHPHSLEDPTPIIEFILTNDTQERRGEAAPRWNKRPQSG